MFNNKSITIVIPAPPGTNEAIIHKVIEEIEPFADRIILARWEASLIANLPIQCIQLCYNYLSAKATSEEIVNEIVVRRFFGHDTEWLGVISPQPRSNVVSLLGDPRETYLSDVKLEKTSTYLERQKSQGFRR